MFLAAILVASIVSLPVAVPALSDSVGTLTAETWAQESKLEPADLEPGEWAGFAVDIDGSTAVVGAPSTWGADHPGRVFVFEERDDGWNQVATLTGEHTADLFGNAVAIDGDRIAVGAPHGDTPDTDFAGAVYTYERSGDGTWEQTAAFAGDDSDLADEFGTQVALDGDTLAVGAKGDEPNGLEHEGSAYVFELGPEGWEQQAKLVPEDPEEDARFGFDIDVEEDTVLVGVMLHDSQENNGGTAYVFEPVAGSGWTQTAQLWSSDIDAFDRFGRSVSLDNGRAAIGAPGHTYSTYPGAAYIFDRQPDGTWTEQTRLQGDGDTDDTFGRNIDLDGDRLVVGASTANGIDNPNVEALPPSPTVSGLLGSGAAFVFENRTGSWEQTAKVMADDRGSVGPVPLDDGADPGSWDWDRFGEAVALDGDRFLVGAYQADTEAGDQSGSAYVFQHGCQEHAVPAPATPPAPGCVSLGGPG